MTTIRAHWYDGKGGRNFGDALTQMLFARLAGIELEWAPAASAQLFGAGSIAHRIPPGFTGTVWGTGYMWAAQHGDLSHAKVVAVRGALSAAQAGLRGTSTLLADPGVLAGALLPHRKPATHDLGVVPHYADKGLRKRFRGHRVNVLAGVPQVVAEVASCRRVVTSSLHVLALCDSLGIESRWEPCKAVIGNGHKFRDYASAYGERLLPGRWRLADQEQVRDKGEMLLEAMRRLA